MLSVYFSLKYQIFLYTRYPIVARALGLAAAHSAFRPSARASKGILHTTNFRAWPIVGRLCLPRATHRRSMLAHCCARVKRGMQRVLSQCP